MSEQFIIRVQCFDGHHYHNCYDIYRIFVSEYFTDDNGLSELSARFYNELGDKWGAIYLRRGTLNAPHFLKYAIAPLALSRAMLKEYGVSKSKYKEVHVHDLPEPIDDRPKYRKEIDERRHKLLGINH